jgi:pyrimidine-nucleoside phosphorylase
MRAVDIIIKKRDGLVLSHDEIDFFIQEYANERIPDYQAAAWAMAVLLKGMDAQETTDLTLAIARSGEVLDLSGVVDLAVDKHSTGGVGDKTTLVVEPIVAACGLPVGKMSGRGLGFSGGTLDKMESIPGFRTDLSTEEFLDHLKRIGLVLTGQTADLAPADGKLYGLRDVTGTVPSIPLIASSVMSKKIASGAQAILLDVKIGLGAFMETVAEGRLLAERMVAIGQLSGRRVIALLSDMNQPLGVAVGNSLELKEAIDTLKGGGPEDFREHCLEIAARMLLLGRKVSELEQGRRQAESALADGRAWEKFRTLVSAQGGDVAFIDDPSRLPTAAVTETVQAKRSGWLAQVHARVIGETAVELGAGRARKGDPIDHGVGILVHHNVGDRVEERQILFTIYARNRSEETNARIRLEQSLVWSDQPLPPLPLFYGIVE